MGSNAHLARSLSLDFILILGSQQGVGFHPIYGYSQQPDGFHAISGCASSFLSLSEQ